MRRALFLLSLLALLSSNLLFTSVEAQRNLDAMIEREMASLVSTYKALHSQPELSHYEAKTSALLARELRSLGYTVTERIGRYRRSDWQGYGLVGVMKNGDGPVVLVRADMDALPVEEKTGLPYASSVRVKNDAGQEVGVMHACGHDIHVTSLIGMARMLAALKAEWRGTLVLLGQPAEETGDGAKAMLDDGLYSKIPRPDYAIALHDQADIEAGKVGVTPGYAMANVTSVDITVRGIGGHGARPESTKDPIVLTSQIILALQTIVSRENSPLDPAVVTVGSIHGGARYNIIPDEVKLQLTIRSYKEEVRQRILASIERIARGIAQAAGLPLELAPVVKVNELEGTLSTYNDPALSGRLSSLFAKTLGAQNVLTYPPAMVGEDFGRFGLEGHQIPTVIFWVGAAEASKVEESRRTGKPLPSLHSPLFAPLPEPTIKTGVKAMTSAVLDLMKR
ncbi:MAG TPA: amidohydrolase [Pyrinomonadaceae bacterium]|nr:amidohydrolase [Pyrinomonadaceae bacterium]